MLDMDITGSHRGMLIPRIPLRDAADRTSIPNPADYLLVFSPYTETPSYMGLSYWHNNRWNRLLNQTELYDSISSYHIAQIVLFVNQSRPESETHVTDKNEKAPYKLPLDNVIFDSQNAYNKTIWEYVIPEAGIYEIVCNVMLDVIPGISMQTYVRINDSNAVNDLIRTLTLTVGSVVYIAKLEKGDRVYGAVGAGSWNKDTYKVVAGSLSILKY
jgi:hypothetical protein